MNRYYIGDVIAQERLLIAQLGGFSTAYVYGAVQAMRKRVARRYGLLNKYNADGTKRK